MKGLVLVGIIVILVSTMFIILLFSTLVKMNLTCLGDPDNPRIIRCDLRKYNIDLIFSLMMIAFFVMLDVGAVYLMFSGPGVI